MHDPRALLDPTTDAVRRLARKGYALDVASLDKLLAGRNSAIQRGDEARAESKRVATSVKGASPQERPALVERARDLKGVVAAAEEESRALDAELQDLLLGIPNLPLDELPDGTSDADAELVRTWGEKPEIADPLDHVDLGEKLGILDLTRATKLSGPRFAVLKGRGAKLERALARYFLDLAEQHGYTEFSVPTLVNRATMTGTGQLPKFAEDLFRTGTDDRELYLIPTAEVPLTNLHAQETLALEDLPLAYTAHTPCFRSEAGSYGRDTRGLVRLHEFSKVELVRLVDPATSRDALELLVGHAEAVLQGLGLTYRVVKLAAGDTGFSAQMTYDIEVWLPGQDAYREIASASDFGTFQARRAGIRTKAKDGTRGFAGTLNTSGLPIGRTLVALLEQGQQPDGSVRIPEALVPYTGFDTLTAS
ncbi:MULTISPECIES: serine--tRNA ligase [unclassified Pseudonocardia]|jgi:seryl-tRNA synthetase|uniref:serine--tRNA ligase n=1 Tax=unclassified Pseudonocardia TaxID=2619320 RepID=UPI0009676E65|nr:MULTISPECIES: serine--tRNA ligase [unclassified Pseudonocardia]MBN9100431.1 serine--tRNA ligase [Pseudonocardia sp.]OJY37512.1 MAG: serine--tRNA ligase [Pseudonocardia sp. 73-21]